MKPYSQTPFHFHAPSSSNCGLQVADIAQQIRDGVDRLWDTQLRRFFETLWPGEPAEAHAEELMQHGRWIIPQHGRGKSFSWKGEIIFSGDFNEGFGYTITPHTPP